nr:hypothetical protein GCM10023233_28140 [Brevibacterium otitidis]
MLMLAELAAWQPRRWLFALAAALVTVLFVAIPTDLIDTPLFVRDVPPTWWAWPVLIANAVLAGLVAATYVARRDTGAQAEQRSGRLGAAGAIVTFFAVGCPVCNKLVLLALGYAGALQYFAPVQPILALGSVVLLAWAFVTRVRKERSCPLPGAGQSPPATASGAATTADAATASGAGTAAES